MADGEIETYYQSPLFQEAMRYFQSGGWEDGLNRLAEVEKQYPLNVELRSLRQEMQVRSHIDLVEKADARVALRKQIFSYGSRIAVLLLVVLAVAWGTITYYNVIQQRVVATTNQAQVQIKEVQALTNYRNAQNLLLAGKSDQALQMLTDLAITNPDLPGLNAYIDQAKAQKALDDRYAQGLDLLKTGDLQGALAIFKEIQTDNPQYKDVTLQVQMLESQGQLSTILSQADAAFQAGKWETAVTGYETLHTLDANYQANYVSSQLFQSYVNAASEALNEAEPTMDGLQKAENYFSLALSLRPQDPSTLSKRAEVRATITTRMVNTYLSNAEAALVGQSDSLAALQTAEGYFTKALELRPGDPMILTKYQMAVNYLAAIDSYTKGAWDDVITGMQKVTALDPNYANGTARQALYEALIARGDDRTATGDYLLALDDYQQAAILARQMTNTTVGQFEAQTRIAETQGLLGNQKDAVLIYQAALETVGLRDAILVSDTSLSTDLRSAEDYAARGNYPTSFNLYRKVMADWVAAVGTQDYQVQAGDYLPMLARRYNTTVSAILAANGLTARFTLQPDTQLHIPTKP